MQRLAGTDVEGPQRGDVAQQPDLEDEVPGRHATELKLAVLAAEHRGVGAGYPDARLRQGCRVLAGHRAGHRSQGLQQGQERHHTDTFEWSSPLSRIHSTCWPARTGMASVTSRLADPMALASSRGVRPALTIVGASRKVAVP